MHDRDMSKKRKKVLEGTEKVSKQNLQREAVNKLVLFA